MIKDVVRTVALAVAGVVTLLTIILGLNWLFGPAFEDVRRDVFESTRSYNQAKIQELAKYRLEYLRSDEPLERAAIASTVRHRFADYDDAGLPEDLRDFLREVNSPGSR